VIIITALQIIPVGVLGVKGGEPQAPITPAGKWPSLAMVKPLLNNF